MWMSGGGAGAWMAQGRMLWRVSYVLGEVVGQGNVRTKGYLFQTQRETDFVREGTRWWKIQ